MIFPIQNEEGATRQLPYLTWALIALCVATFALTHSEPVEQIATPKRSMAEAAAYWRDRGYLEPAPDVITEVGLDVAGDQREQYLEKLRTRAVDWRPQEEEVLKQEQAELDRLTRLGVGVEVPAEARANPLHVWGFVAAEPSAQRLVTHPFLHGGWIHLLSNLLVIALIGPALESRWGRGRFATVLALIALASAGAHWRLAAPAQAALPLLGTTPIAAGLLGAFLLRLWPTQIQYYYFFGTARSGTFDSPAWLMLPLALFAGGLQLLFANEAVASTWWAQLGALGVALPATLALRHFHLEDEFADGINHSLPGSVATDDAGPQHSAPELLSLIEDYSARGEVESACRHWAELARRFPQARVAAPILVKLAPSMARRGQTQRATLALRHALDHANPGLTPGMALRIHDEQRVAHPEISLLAAERALELGDLQQAKRERLEAAIEELRIAVEQQGETASAEIRDDANATGKPAGHAVESDALAGAASRPTRPDAAPLPAAKPAPAANPTPKPAPAATAAPAGSSRSRAETLAAIIEDRQLRALDALPLYPDLKVIEAVPLLLDPDGLQLEVGPGRRFALAFENISAVATAVVDDLGPRPVLLIDLVLGWGHPGEDPLRSVRMRSDAFDPRIFTTGVKNPVAALRQMLEHLLDSSAAVGLPDSGAAVGRPFSHFEDLASYEREVLCVDR